MGFGRTHEITVTASAAAGAVVLPTAVASAAGRRRRPVPRVVLTDAAGLAVSPVRKALPRRDRAVVCPGGLSLGRYGRWPRSRPLEVPAVSVVRGGRLAAALLLERLP